jgi:ubiquinone/menaquinone biosynthesis C-methylase UbiE
MAGIVQTELKGEYYSEYLKVIQKRLNNPWSLHGIHHRHLNNFIQKEVVQLPQGAKVLDGGCGLSIWITPEIEQRVKYIGLDCQEDSISFCQKTFPSREYLLGDLYKLPFPDNYFDAVVMREVIEHVKQPELVREEVKRILKPGGKWIFTTPNYSNVLLHMIENIYNRFFVKNLKPHLEDVHPSKFDRKKIRAFLENQFELVNIGGIDLNINFAVVCRVD